MNPNTGRLRLIGVSGSLRRESYNAALLNAFRRCCRPTST